MYVIDYNTERVKNTFAFLMFETDAEKVKLGIERFCQKIGGGENL